MIKIIVEKCQSTMTCDCGYSRVYPKQWQAEASADSHLTIGLCPVHGQVKSKETYNYIVIR